MTNRLHRVGQHSAGEHRGAGHGQRPEPLDEPVVEIFCHADGGVLGAEQDGGHEDSGHEVVRVACARDVDRAAEHVPEHQHEQHRLDRHEGQQLRSAGHADDVALGDRQRVGGGPRQLRSAPGRQGEVGWCGEGGHEAPPVLMPPPVAACAAGASGPVLA
jgi:hypothetical protein